MSTVDLMGLFGTPNKAHPWRLSQGHFEELAVEKISELESFLKAQSEAGEAKEQGTFTLDRQKALEKLAAFQLPFQGAWALKVVQAAVVGGCIREIRIKLKRSECHILFDSEVHWDLRRLETELSSPTESLDRAYRHLVTALRGVAFREKRSFLFVPQNSMEGLLWDGETFQTFLTEERRAVCSLSVTHLSPNEGNLFSRNFGGKRAAETAALTRVLASRCFVCPAPIYLDKRRIDSFLLNPIHGLTKSSFPCEVFSHDCESLPKWRQPQTGVSLPDQPHSGHYYGNIKQIISESLHSQELPHSSSVSHFLCAHFHCVEAGDSIAWEVVEVESQAYWVSDGVLIDQETTMPQATAVSSCLYLTADGLETDLTGFKLLQSPTRKSRIADAMRLIKDDVASSQLGSYEYKAKNLANSPAIPALATSIAVPAIIGFKAIALPFAIVAAAVSGYQAYKQREKDQERILSVHQGLDKLQALFSQVGTGPIS